MNRPIRSIFVPHDFGEASREALDLALQFARAFDAEVTIFHAYPIPVASYTYGAGLVWPLADYSAAAQRDLDALVAATRVVWPRTQGVLEGGEPWSLVVEGIRQRRPDLVVMGTHGRRGVSRVLLGSVAERVVRYSPVPVLTVSASEEREARQRSGGATAQATPTPGPSTPARPA